MSLLRTFILGLGRSITPANNFTASASADNGTFTLYRGNAGSAISNIFSVGADDILTFAKPPKVAGQSYEFGRTLRVQKAYVPAASVVEFLGAEGPPAWAKEITIDLYRVSGGGAFMVRIGAGSFLVTGYTSASAYSAATNTVNQISSTAYFALTNVNTGYIHQGRMTLSLLEGFGWSESHVAEGGNWCIHGGGHLPITQTIDRLSIGVAAGAFTNGIFVVTYRG